MMLTSQVVFLSLTIGNITAHIKIVKGGVRSVASVMVRNEYIEESKRLIKAEKLFMILSPRAENHTTIYIFKHSCMKNVINFTLSKPCNKKALIQWIHGKMFGYPDEEIARFIGKNQNITSSCDY